MGAISLVTQNWQVQFAAFSLLAIVPAVVAAWRGLRQGRQRRLRQSLVGRTAVVRHPIRQGARGEVLVDGCLWIAVAPQAQRNLPRSEPVRIVGVDGLVLLVEPIAKQKPSAPLGTEGKAQEGL